MSDTDRPEFTRAEKSAAWDWLRRVALDDNNPHAQVAIVEWQAFFNALRDIANDPDSDARRLTSVAVDALTHGDPSFANVGRKDAIHDMKARLADATELLARAEDDLGEWERIHGSDPQTTRLRLEITGFMAVPAVSERWCECGERLSGHEDESSTSCRWCVTGWRRSNGDQADSASACTCDGEYKYDGDCPIHGDPSFASDQPTERVK